MMSFFDKGVFRPFKSEALPVSAFSGGMGLAWGNSGCFGCGVCCFPQEGYNHLAAALQRLGAPTHRSVLDAVIKKKCFILMHQLLRSLNDVG